MKLHRLCVYEADTRGTPVHGIVAAKCWEYDHCEVCPYQKSTEYSGGHPSGAEVLVKVLKLETK